MILMLICAAIGWIILLAGIYFSNLVWRDKSLIDRAPTGFVIFIISIAIWWGFNIGGIFYVNRNIETTYIQPSNIIKTNALTMVTHIDKNGYVVSSVASREASWYIATNIMVEVKSGNNLYGNPVSDEYKIVMR